MSTHRTRGSVCECYSRLPGCRRAADVEVVGRMMNFAGSGSKKVLLGPPDDHEGQTVELAAAPHQTAALAGGHHAQRVLPLGEGYYDLFDLVI